MGVHMAARVRREQVAAEEREHARILDVQIRTRFRRVADDLRRRALGQQQGKYESDSLHVISSTTTRLMQFAVKSSTTPLHVPKRVNSADMNTGTGIICG